MNPSLPKKLEELAAEIAQVMNEMAKVNLELTSVEIKFNELTQMSADLNRRHNELLDEFNDHAKVAKKLEPKLPKSDDPIFRRPVNELSLDVRAKNCLLAMKIYYLGDIVQLTENGLLRLPNIGRSLSRQIKNEVKHLGLTLGMKLTNWPPADLE
jgi:DNA-directed RNA polymerase alpha subunit